MGCDCLDRAGQPCSGGSSSTCFACRKGLCESHVEHAPDGRTFCPACAFAQGLVPCRGKVGFLTIRDCKVQAVARCTGCGAPLCQAHAVAGSAGVVCAACAKCPPTAPPGDPASAGVGSDAATAVAGRAAYVPFYWGSDRSYYDEHMSGRHYDEADMKIFDEHRSRKDEAEADDGGSFQGS